MRTSFRLLATTLCIGLFFLCAGCGALILGGAAAAGTYVYFDGQSKNTYHTNLNTAYRASKQACTALSIPITREAIDGRSATVEGRLSGDTVTISLQSVGEQLTTITIRVGLFGDESTSLRIHTAIRERLYSLAAHFETPLDILSHA